MNTKIKAFLFPLLLALIAYGLSGCTVVGFAMGGYRDLRNRQNIQATPQHPETIPHGCRVQVAMARGDTVSGILESVEELPVGNYTQLYNARRDSLASTVHLPAMGTPVTITLQSGEIIQQRFVGFGAQSLLLQSTWISDWERPKRSEYPLAEIRDINDAAGNSYPVRQIEELMASKQLPPRRAVLLRTSHATTRIPLQSVNSLTTVPRHTYYAVEGLLLGAAVDAALVGVGLLIIANSKTGGGESIFYFGY